jgi:UDP-N-acetylmuramoylalanine--D-glutamate ligase
MHSKHKTDFEVIHQDFSSNQGNKSNRKKQPWIYLVIGLGKTGISCIEYLVDKGENVAVADTRTNPSNLKDIKEKYPCVNISTGAIPDELIKRANTIIVSPGISFNESFIQKAINLKKEIIGDVELFVRSARAPIIAVTGTNGKTTVTTLIGEIAEKSGLKVLVGGNIGTPALDLLEQPKPDLYVLELSSFQLQTTLSMCFDVSILLNITEDHIDHHGSINSYRNAKFKIFKNCKTAVINEALLSEIFPCNNYDINVEKIFNFSLNKPSTSNDFGIVESNGNKLLANGDEILMPVSDLKIVGIHNQENVLSVLAACKAFGLKTENITSVLKEFKGIKHRCQLIREKNSIKWYNDSKATNVGATVASVTGLGSKNKNIILIAGGVGKNADFTKLREPIKNHVKTVILFGRDVKIISNAIKNTANIICCENLQKTIEIAENLSEKGDIILFAPACASFDMFKNYEHRGDEFTNLSKQSPKK